MQPTFLQADEVPLAVQRRHPLSALDNWLGLAFTVAAIVGATLIVAAWVPEVVPFVPGIAVAAVALGAASATAVWFRVATSLNVITPDRVYHAHGKLRFYLAQTTYDRVTDLHVRQSLFGRRFGFGTVLVQTAGHGVALVGVRDPLAVKRVIEDAREAMVRRLVAAHRPAARRAAAPADAAATAQQTASPSPAGVAAVPRQPGQPLWRGQPTGLSIVAQMGPVAMGLVVMLVFLGPALAQGGAQYAFALPLLFLVAVAALAARGLVLYRTLRYEVHPWGVAVTSGWLSRSRIEARYEKVTDVAVTQGMLGRLFGFGSIRINTAGSNEAPITFAGVRLPDHVKARIDAARQGGPA